MDGLGDLFVLMVNAHRSFRTLRGEVRNWHHNERSHEAATRAHTTRVARGRQIAIAVRPAEHVERVALIAHAVVAPTTPTRQSPSSERRLTT